jgi:uroporphyrinogen-III synthase
MHVLVTRPQPDASHTAARLTAMGHAALVQPLLAITFTLPPGGLPAPAAILVTSQNALRALEQWPEAASWRGVSLFAAGPATARAAEAQGFRNVRRGVGDAGALAEIVRSQLPRGAGPILYPAARDRAGALEGRLTAAGYDVRVIEAYRADAATAFDPPVRAAFEVGWTDGVLLYSRRTALAFHDLAVAEGLTARMAGICFYVISEQVAEVVRPLGGTVQIAERPDEDTLLALIPPA